MAPLPQTSPQGGPNPNSPITNRSVSVLDLPGMGGTVNGALTGAARASLMSQLYGGSDEASATQGAVNGLPGYDPNAQSMVGLVGTAPADPRARSAGAGPAVDPNAGSMDQEHQLAQAQGAFGNRMTSLVRGQQPSTYDAIHNWMFGGGGTAEGQTYAAKTYASSVLGSDAAKTYFGAHPSLLAHAEADPVGFAQKLGPIIEAKSAAAAGQRTPGQVVHLTADGPMLKNDDHTEMTDAVSKGFGMPQGQAHAMTQPHHYTPQEWLSATEGVTNKQLQQMWEMQHYLSPDQQASAMYLKAITGDAQATKMGLGPPNPAQAQLERNLQALAFKNPYIQ